MATMTSPVGLDELRGLAARRDWLESDESAMILKHDVA